MLKTRRWWVAQIEDGCFQIVGRSHVTRQTQNSNLHILHALHGHECKAMPALDCVLPQSVMYARV